MAREGLTDLQLDVMRALWRLGQGTVAEVSEAMEAEGRHLAPTTVATLLSRMGKQGWVTCLRADRPFVYRAKVQEAEAARGGLSRLLTSFFGGRAAALTAHLLASGEVSDDELEEMRRLLDTARNAKDEEAGR